MSQRNSNQKRQGADQHNYQSEIYQSTDRNLLSKPPDQTQYKHHNSDNSSGLPNRSDTQNGVSKYKKKKLEIKIEDEAAECIAPPPTNGNLYTTHSTLGNFAETPSNDKLVQHTQKLTSAMKNNLGGSSSLGSFSMKKKANGGSGSIRSSNDRYLNSIHPYMHSSQEPQIAGTQKVKVEFFSKQGSAVKINNEEGSQEIVQLGTIDTDEGDLVADNRNWCLKFICPINDSPYMISHNSKFKTRWDIMIILLALFAVFVTPFQIAFNPPDLNSSAYKAISWIIDILFALDVLVNFRTTIIDETTNMEIKDARIIAKKYVLNGRFIIDVISSIPLEALIDTHSNKLKLVSIFKLSRIFRFTRIISFLNATEDLKLSLKLFKLIFYLVIYLHLQACAWYFFTVQDKVWFPLTDIIQRFTNFYDQPIYYTYCFSIWHSSQIMAGADMVPANAHQAIVTSLLLLSSSFIDGSILGTISVILQSLNRKGTKLQEQIEFATTTMKNIQLSTDIQKQVTEYMRVKQNDLDSQEELENLMKIISPSLRHIVTQHLFHNVISQTKVFEDIPEAIEFVVQNIEVQVYQPEEYIIKQGQKAQYMYFLAQGECEVLVKDQTKKDSFVRDIFSGGMFGEIALLYNTKRTASVRSKGHCTVGALSDEQFSELIQNNPEIEQRMLLEARKYDDHWKLFQISTISQVDYFHHLPYSVREDIHYRLQVENFEKGAQIFTKGQECQNIYFLIKGEIELLVDRNNQNHQLDLLAAGSFIGAYSLINENPFLFTAKAKTNVSLLVLNREILFNLADDSEHITDAIEEATQYIIDNEVPKCDYYQVRPDSLRQLKYAESMQQMMAEISYQMRNQQLSTSGSKNKLQAANKFISNENEAQKQPKFNSLSPQLLINPLRQHKTLIEIRKRFKNGVRRLIVLNKGKEQKRIKIIELINFIRAQKKKTEHLNAILDSPQPAPIPQKRQSNNQQFLMSNNPAKKQSSAAIRKTSALAFNFMGDLVQTQQGDYSQDIQKLGKKLDNMLNIMKNQQTDIALIKQALKIQSSDKNFKEASFDAKSIYSPKQKFQIQTKMTGIVEEEAEENSIKSSASVSDATPKKKIKGSIMSPDFTMEGEQSMKSLQSSIGDTNINLQQNLLSQKNGIQTKFEIDQGQRVKSAIKTQDSTGSQTQLNKLLRSPVNNKYSSSYLIQVGENQSNTNISSNPTPMRLMVERFIQSKIQSSHEDHFSALREVVNLAKQNNLIDNNPLKKKNDSSVMSNSQSKSSQKSIDFGKATSGSPVKVSLPYMGQIKAKVESSKSIQAQVQKKSPVQTASPLQPKNNIKEKLSDPDYQPSKQSLTNELMTQNQLQFKQQHNTSATIENPQDKKINAQYVHQVMNMIKFKQQALNKEPHQTQDRQPPTMAQINQKEDESLEESENNYNSIIPAKTSKNFIINQASRYSIKEQNSSQDNKLINQQESSKRAANIGITNQSAFNDNSKSRNLNIYEGKDQLSVDNSAFEISNGNIRNITGAPVGTIISADRSQFQTQLNINGGGTRIEDISGASRTFNTSNTGDMNLLLGSGIPQIDQQLAVQTEYFNPIMQVDSKVQHSNQVSKLKLITNRDMPIPEFRDSMSPMSKPGKNQVLPAPADESSQQSNNLELKTQKRQQPQQQPLDEQLSASQKQDTQTQQISQAQKNDNNAQQLRKSKENLAKAKYNPRTQLSNDSLIVQQELARMNYKKSSKHLEIFQNNSSQKQIPEIREGELDELIEQEFERMEDDEY